MTDRCGLWRSCGFLGRRNQRKVQEAKQYFQKKIEECGGNVVEGIFKGIVDGVKGIGTWIKQHIFDPFIDGFKNAFGIHSPSTVMAEQGGFNYFRTTERSEG